MESVMSDAGAVTARLRDPRPGFRTLRVEGSEWRDQRLLQQAFLSTVSDRSHLMVGISLDGGAVTAESEQAWRMWMAPPDRMRVEFAVGSETVTAVFEGQTWWSWSPSGGGQTNGGRTNTEHGLGPGEILVRPASVVPALELEVLGEVARLGRQAYRVRATPARRDERQKFFALHALGSGADEYELLVDKERGFLLRAEARRDGQPFRMVEMTALALDEELAPEVFQPPAAQSFSRVAGS
jgi:hypothetical protein